MDAVGVRLRRGAQVRVAAPRAHSPGGLGELVRGCQRRVVEAAVGGLPGERAGGQAELRRHVERPRRVGPNHGLRSAVGAARRARADRPGRGAELEVHEVERRPGRRRRRLDAALPSERGEWTRVAGREEQDASQGGHAAAKARNMDPHG